QRAALGSRPTVRGGLGDSRADQRGHRPGEEPQRLELVSPVRAPGAHRYAPAGRLLRQAPANHGVGRHLLRSKTFVGVLSRPRNLYRMTCARRSIRPQRATPRAEMLSACRTAARWALRLVRACRSDRRVYAVTASVLICTVVRRVGQLCVIKL